MTFKPCQECQTPYPYEPIELDGIDIMQSFAHYCDACALVHERKREEAKRTDRIAAAQAMLAEAIPPRLRETDIKHEKFNLPAWELIKNNTNPYDTRNILIVGKAGICKSRILALLCKRAALRGQQIAWITAHEFSLLADRYKNYKTRFEAGDQINRLKYIDRLVFDDLGKQEWTNAIEEVFFYLIDHRHSHNKPTWFSCNTHPRHMLLDGKLSRDRGAAIIGRIVDDALEFDLQPQTNEA